jgi:hypothetical protein
VLSKDVLAIKVVVKDACKDVDKDAVRDVVELMQCFVFITITIILILLLLVITVLIITLKQNILLCIICVHLAPLWDQEQCRSTQVLGLAIDGEGVSC